MLLLLACESQEVKTLQTKALNQSKNEKKKNSTRNTSIAILLLATLFACKPISNNSGPQPDPIKPGAEHPTYWSYKNDPILLLGAFNHGHNPFIDTLLLFLIFAMLSCQQKTEQSSSDFAPNIILILVDDMGYSDLGCFGSEIATPNIDQLANRGIRFTQFYNSARCCPSRASLMTGLYPHQAGIPN